MTDTQAPKNTEQPLPLAGLRVVEFVHMVMGPTAGLVLADLGADVIKVEPLKGDATRSLTNQGAGFFAAYNRNKRSLAVDLKSPDGIAAAKRLVASADVMTENFRPGAMAKLGLDYGTLAVKHPSLIYCSLKGFLPGPYGHRKALDEVVQMMAGLAYMTGPEGRPLRAGASVNDIMGGMFGVIGILAALRQRETTGRGQEIKAALFETTVHIVAQHMLQFAVTGEPAGPMPDRPRAWAVYDVFEAADGGSVFIGVVSDTQWNLFCEAFGRPDLQNDPGLATNPLRCNARDRIMPIIRGILGAFPKAELLDICERIGLPFAPITKPHELYDDPHLKASGGLLDITLSDGSSIQVPALPLEIGGRRLGLRHDLPLTGEHGTEVLAEIGYDAAAIGQLISNGVIRVTARD